MKITCHACGAKYAIADEKVRGRRVKVRCKSCSEPIIVDGYVEQQANEPDEDERTHMVGSGAAAAAPPADAWSVNVSDTDQRTMTTDELVSAWNAGQLPADTYVWKEGMADWAPVTSTPDLLPYLTAGGAYHSAPLASAAPAYTPIGGKPAAARVAGGRAHGGADLFGAAAAAAEAEGVVSSAPGGGDHSPPQPGSTGYSDKMTGARNENSVLFSLDSLKVGLGSAPAKSAPTASRPSAPKQDSADLDDIMDMGGSSNMNPLFAFQQNQSLLSAPPPPPDPPPRPAFPSDPGMVNSFSPMPAPKSNSKLIIAVGGAVALVAILAVVIGVVVVKSGGDDAVAKSETAAKLDAKSDKSDKKKDEGSTRPASAEKTEETSKDEAAPAGSAGSAGSAEKKPVTEEEKKRFAEAQAKKKEEAAKAGETAKTEEVTKKEAPSSGVASFNKGAAIAALGAAAAQASGCKRPGGPTGGGRAVVTFAPSGRVTSATVSGGDFPGTPVGSCVASVFRRANVPAFSGDAVTVSKGFSIAP